MTDKLLQTLDTRNTAIVSENLPNFILNIFYHLYHSHEKVAQDGLSHKRVWIIWRLQIHPLLISGLSNAVNSSASVILAASFTSTRKATRPGTGSSRSTRARHGHVNGWKKRGNILNKVDTSNSEPLGSINLKKQNFNRFLFSMLQINDSS